MRLWTRLVASTFVVLWVLLAPSGASAQRGERELPSLSPPEVTASVQRIQAIEIVTEGELWHEQVQLERVRPGDPLSGEIARRALRELLDTGRFADARAEAIERNGQLVLRLTVLPRRVVARIQVDGSPLNSLDVQAAAELASGEAITAYDLETIAERVQKKHAERGYLNAEVRAEAADTDDPTKVLLTILVTPGDQVPLARVRFRVRPWPLPPQLAALLKHYAVRAGDTADEEALRLADEALHGALRDAGWLEAKVSHRLSQRPGRLEVVVDVAAGPRFELQVTGNATFDLDQIETSLKLGERDDLAPAAMAQELEQLYRRHGFLDADVAGSEWRSSDGQSGRIQLRVREGTRLQITQRHFPCLTGPLSPQDLNLELDGALAQDLPGDSLLRPVDADSISSSLGPRSAAGGSAHSSAPAPRRDDPTRVYDDEAYDRALKHIEDLYHSRGYLDAQIGPARLLRQRCEPGSPPGTCRGQGEQRVPELACAYDEIGMPLPEPELPDELTCREDLKRGIYCSGFAELAIPVKLGPQTFLYDVSFEGNRALAGGELLEVSELVLGEPLSLVKLERARRLILDRYAEDAYAFADIVAELELSTDRTRARVRLVVSERAQVRVSRIVIKGARRTNEGLVRDRVALQAGGLYRRSLVRRTEEQLAALGVFSSVTVDFQDPYVPAREKTVVVSVVERNHQYLDQRPGFSTGEGFRITFEYGHRSIAGSAVRFTGLFQLSFLPTALIFEEDVRRKFDELQLIDRLERRNSITLQFPDIGLGPPFRLNVEGVDVRDNSRDFGITKDAAILTLIYRATRSLSVQLGGAIELNDASIFGEEQKGALEDYVLNNPQLRNVFRVPEGETLAFSQAVRVDWDRRNAPLEATRGSLVSVGVEHVQATPVGADRTTDNSASGVFAAAPSDFLRYTNRLAGYTPLSDTGSALAVSLRWGVIQQLSEASRTYPDRLFFVGGFDTVRGFLQDSMIPEDIAQRLLASAADPNCQSESPPGDCLTTREVVVRGGDLFVNPRVEVRIPLSETLRTAVFVDAGNLWTEADLSVLKSPRLRYALGSGLRVGTPIGPLVFDYGLNLERLFDSLELGGKRPRFWEDLGAFHFSIGVF